MTAAERQEHLQEVIRNDHNENIEHEAYSEAAEIDVEENEIVAEDAALCAQQAEIAVVPATLNVAEKVTTEAEEAATVFICEVCDSTFKNKRALRTHQGRQHKASSDSPIPQLDGQVEKLDFIFSFNSEYGPFDIEYTVEEMFPEAIKAKLISREKIGSQESDNHLCTISLELPDDQKLKWPVMTKVQTEVIRDIKLISSC